MTLRYTAHEKAVIEGHDKMIAEHLTTIVKGWLMVGASYEMRGDEYAEMVIIHSSKAAGLIVAIATLRGITSAQVNIELEEELNGYVLSAEERTAIYG